MFNWYQQVGQNKTSNRPNELFAFYPNSDLAMLEGAAGLISDSLVAWFEPSTNITLSGSNVASWADTSGTYTITQATPANQPAYVMGGSLYKGFPYLSFDGTNDQLTASNILGVGTNAVYTIMCVVAYPTGGVNRSTVNFAVGSVGEYRIGQLNTTGNTIVSLWNGGTGMITSPTLSSNGALSVYAAEINRTAGLLYTSLDSLYRGNSIAIPTTLTDYSTGVLQFGARGTVFANAHLLDVLFYNKTLSNTEYLSNYNYFKNKYGII